MIASLAGLTRLRSLNLSSDSVTAEQLEAAAPLAAQHLTKLGLANNALKKLPAYIAAMTSLADLDLSDNLLTTFPPGHYLGACEKTFGAGLKVAYTNSQPVAPCCCHESVNVYKTVALETVSLVLTQVPSPG